MATDYCPATHRVSSYLDGRLSGQERREMALHLAGCRTCAAALEDHGQVRSALRGLAPRVPPKQLETRLRVLASRAAARQAGRATFPRMMASAWERFRLRADNLMRPLALPLAGGLVVAIALFGMLVPSFAIPPDDAKFDVPTVLSTEATLKSMAPISFSDSDADVVVDLTVDEQGRMVDYSIVEGKARVATEAERRSLENSLLFTLFNPATAFGQPMSGKVRVSIRRSRIDVRG